MLNPTAAGSTRPVDLAADTIALVRRWLAESAEYPTGASATQLAGVLKDANGLDFTLGFVDRVVRPDDLFVAGASLSTVARGVPAFLPWYMRGAVALGGVFGPVVPGVVVPVARRVLRRMVGHLLVDATADKLGPAIEKLREDGSRLNLNLLGEAVLGEAEAARRLAGTRKLLERNDVDYVSVKVSSVVSQLSMWAFDEAVERIVTRLTPLYEFAASSPTPKFINLDMEEYKDLDLTIAAFERILDQPSLLRLEAGIVLQAYLPDAVGALTRITDWSMRRRARGGAPIKVRVVKGANLAMERVDATIHGWPLAPYDTKQDTDANYKRVLDYALTPEHTDAVRIGVAGHNLFDVAYAWLLAGKRGVRDSIDFEMLLGMATGQADAVRREVGGLLLYTPVVHPGEFDVAISYLVRRLEENASSENFMSAVFELTSNERLFEREKRRFLRSLDQVDATVPAPHRTQDRAAVPELVEGVSRPVPELVEGASSSVPELVEGTSPSVPELVEGALSARSVPSTGSGTGTGTGTGTDGLTSVVLGFTRGSRAAAPADATDATSDDLAPAGFRNAPDTDPSLAANREWGRAILSRVPASTLGNDAVAGATISDASVLDRLLDATAAAGAEWGARPARERAGILRRAARSLEAHRADLIEAMASETGKTIAEGDPEVSEAIDFANYYGDRAVELENVQGAVFVPARLTVVTPPWNFPVAIPAGSVLAALAAGSGVILKPAVQAQRTGSVLAEVLWQAGVPRDVLSLAHLSESELGKQLVTHPRVDRVILTGAYETAELFRSWRPDLPLLAETSGKNAIVVTPSADLDVAVADVVRSAFGHAGQKCSAASLVILVGSVARSRRFRTQLVDAVRSLRVGYPEDPATNMGPIIEPAAGKLKHALTQLGGGENWLVEPRQLDESARLWSPGVRSGVRPGSYFHRTEFFGPVLGIMTARTLAEAVRLQNAVSYGLTAGLHSLDGAELGQWLDTVEAGNLYVNRGITGAIVQRQPFGGWKRSSVGAGSKAGGPNYLMGLGEWRTDPGHHSTTLHLRGLAPRVTELIESAQPSIEYSDFDIVRRSALSDAVAWQEEFGAVRDVQQLGVERNVFRYLSLPVTIRLADDGRLADLVRVLAAATLARAAVTVSSGVELPAGMLEVLDVRGYPVAVESDAEWLARVGAGQLETERVRLIGGDASALAAALRGAPDVAIYAGEVTAAGRVELLPFLREQAVSVTAHRFGNPDGFSDDAI